MTLGLGTYLPSNSSIVQILGRRCGGTASALGGGLPFLTGALMTPLTGLLGQQSVMLMSAAMSGFFAVAAACGPDGTPKQARTRGECAWAGEG